MLIQSLLFFFILNTFSIQTNGDQTVSETNWAELDQEFLIYLTKTVDDFAVDVNQENSIKEHYNQVLNYLQLIKGLNDKIVTDFEDILHEYNGLLQDMDDDMIEEEDDDKTKLNSINEAVNVVTENLELNAYRTYKVIEWFTSRYYVVDDQDLEEKLRQISENLFSTERDIDFITISLSDNSRKIDSLLNPIPMNQIFKPEIIKFLVKLLEKQFNKRSFDVKTDEAINQVKQLLENTFFLDANQDLIDDGN